MTAEHPEDATSPAPAASEKNSASTPHRVQQLRSVTELPSAEWDRLASAGCNSPFLRHDWLRCLEQSGCAAEQTGWTPSHLVLRDGETDAVLAIAPAYIKAHSLGEFVFDQEWADAAYGAGIAYYPKLLLAVPFTPATGRRILTPPDATAERREQLLRIVANLLLRVCDVLQISSVHVNFCAEDEVDALSAAGFMLRKGVQYHFTNYKKGQDALARFEKELEARGDGGNGSGGGGVPKMSGEAARARVPYADFEDYLSEFKSKRRIKMRRERTVVRSESGLRMEILRGDEITAELLDEMFVIYKSTIDKMMFGRQYLSRRFFRMLGESAELKHRLCLVLARAEDDGRVVGGTFNVIGGADGDEAFYGRYWGCVEDIRYLHFETCYYAAIEYCIENGLARMEPGAGGGEFKYMRGFEPCVTQSMHYMRDRRLGEAVARYLEVESKHIDGAVDAMTEQSAIRSKEAKG